MPDSKYKVFLVLVLGVVLVVGVFAFVASNVLFGAPQSGSAPLEQFTIPATTEEDHERKIVDDAREVAELLEEGGFIKNTLGWRIAYAKAMGLGILPTRCVDCIQSGAYKISTSMSAWEVAEVFRRGPYLRWVVIPEGYRKEQIAELLAETFDWSDEEKKIWITTHTAMDFENTEGVYFPDTYLIPTDEEPLKVAERLRAKFNEVFVPYAEEAFRQNIRWPTLLKVASIVQREAAGKDDMPLIAGILRNRLLNDQRLEIDATLQYIKGNKENGWWPPVSPEDKELDSPYNTYRTSGLPPHPISNPGIAAIEAVLFPEETDCFFYLHGADKKIHCAETYEGHKENIEIFLKNSHN